jgi:hypothetical protein
MRACLRVYRIAPNPPPALTCLRRATRPCYFHSHPWNNVDLARTEIARIVAQDVSVAGR